MHLKDRMLREIFNRSVKLVSGPWKPDLGPVNVALESTNRFSPFGSWRGLHKVVQIPHDCIRHSCQFLLVPSRSQLLPKRGHGVALHQCDTLPQLYSEIHARSEQFIRIYCVKFFVIYFLKFNKSKTYVKEILQRLIAYRILLVSWTIGIMTRIGQWFIRLECCQRFLTFEPCLLVLLVLVDNFKL